MKVQLASIYSAITLLACGCNESRLGSLDRYTGNPENLAIFLSCDQFTIRYMEDGRLGFFKPRGDQVFINDGPSVSFKSAPSTSSGHKECGVPISVTKNGKYGTIMPDGSLFANRLFENSYGLYKNTLAYSEDGRWGLIRGDGKIIVPPTYDQIRWYGNRRFLATTGETRLFMDHLGNTTPIQESEDYSTKYQTILPPRRTYVSCAHNMRRASRDGLWGIVDGSETVVVPFKYRAISCLNESGFWAPDEENRSWCEYSPDGQKTTTCATEYYPSWPTHHFPEEFSEDAFENSVIWTRMFLGYGEGFQDAPPAFVGDGVQGFGISPAAPFVLEEMEPDWFR